MKVRIKAKSVYDIVHIALTMTQTCVLEYPWSRDMEEWYMVFDIHSAIEQRFTPSQQTNLLTPEDGGR